MGKLDNVTPCRVFKYFEEISAIPRGSGNMNAISSYCMDFAAKHQLKAMRDEADNVIIFKAGTKGYENAEPVILQGHLDMVCQKTEESTIDFEKDELKLYVDGDFVKAEGTTLGADNGIAVAMIMAILESSDIPHPPIEAVFTTDEETGMIGAGKLSSDCLKGRKMINLDAEEPDTVTVSCAGGSDFRLNLLTSRTKSRGRRVDVIIKGLKGGHSGVEINSGRINANILAGRILNYAKNVTDFEIISIDGGDKGNAIPVSCTMQLVVQESSRFMTKMTEYFEVIKAEYADREDFIILAEELDEGEFDVIGSEAKQSLLYLLMSVPNGVQEMSMSVSGLVETSLNLGILKTFDDKITLLFTLRSNKQSALLFLEEKMKVICSVTGGEIETSGHYPPWEYNDKSELKKMYMDVFKEKFGYEPTVAAIHAGLECGVFSAKIPGLDCIAIGPQLSDVHTVNERCSISSTKDIYELLLNLLKNCK